MFSFRGDIGLAAMAAALSFKNRQMESRLFGAHNIRAHIQRQKRIYGTSTSLAGRPHKDEREIARRLRQQKRDAERREARALMLVAQRRWPQNAVGVSRRGRWTVAA